MVMTDPVSDMLSRIRNGYLAGKRQVEVPYSRIKEELSRLLVKEGFLGEVKSEGKNDKRFLVLKLKYQQGRPVLAGIRRVSKPGLRVYARADKIPLVRLGRGVTVISNSSGLMSDEQAKKKNLGGEVICQVW